MTELEVKEALKGVTDNLSDAVKISSSLNSLANYSRDPAATAHAIRNDAIGTILSAVRQHDGEQTIHLLTWTALGNFCVHSAEAREALKSKDGLATLLKSEGLVKHVPSIEGAALCLANIAADKAAAKQILDNNGVQWVLDRLGREAGDDATREIRLDRALVTTIANLCINDPPAADKTVNAGAIPIVLSVMDKHTDRIEIIDACYAALRMMTFATVDIATLMTDAGVRTRIISAMKTHPESTGVATYGLALLQRLKSKPDECDEAFFATLVPFLRQHISNCDSQRMGIAAIAQVVRGQPAVAANAIAGGALGVVTDALKQHAADSGLAGAALAGMANISMSSPEARTALVAAGGVEAALAGMKASPQVSNVQENGSLLLGNLGFDAAAKQALIDAGAIPVLLAIFSNLGGQWTSIRFAFAALANILSSFEPAREALCADDQALPRIVGVLPQYLDNVELLLVGLSTMTQITVHSRVACTALVRAGIFPVLCQAITKHSGHQRLVKLALQIIQNIAFEEEHSLAFIEAQGAPALATALRAHPNDAAVQNHGCSSVSNVAQTPATVPALIAAGLLPLVLSAIVTHKNDDGVQRAAMAAVARLSAHDSSMDGGNSDGSTPKTTPQQLETLLDVLGSKKDNADVQAVGLAALSNVNIDLDDPAVIKLMKDKGLKAIKEAMEAHPDNAKIQENGCLAIANLGDNAEIAADPVAKELVPVVVKAMKRHEDSPAVTRAGNAALATLMGANPELADTVREAGGIAQVCDGMRKHKDDEGVQETGVLALQNAATNDENNKAIADAGGIELCVDALNKYTDNDNIQTAAATALGSMAATPECARQIAEKGGVDALVSAAERSADKGNDSNMNAACTALEALHASGDDEVAKAMERTGAVDKVGNAMRRCTSAAGKKAGERFLEAMKKKEAEDAAAKEALKKRMREAKGRVAKLVAFFDSWGGVTEGDASGYEFKVQSHRGASSVEPVLTK